MVRRGKQTDDDDDDEDDGFLYRYPLPSTSATNPVSSSKSKSKTGSGGLAPSKSTVYVSNLDYSLTNSDLHTLFSTFGKVARVTVLKDRDSRRSRGVAFVLFVSRLHASAAAAAMDGKILNGRKLTASIAADNGRASEFIRRRVYKDKSRCYECGEEGHLSYECPRNQLGPRERPVEKKQRRGSQGGRRGGGDVAASDGGGDEEEEEEAAAGFEFDDDNWASVVDTRGAEEKAREREEVGGEGQERKRKREKKVSYFSDESGEDE